jgi:hypothetical protein
MGVKGSRQREVNNNNMEENNTATVQLHKIKVKEMSKYLMMLVLLSSALKQ